MRITFQWTQTEWNEAVTLATERRRRGNVSGMVYVLIALPLAGAVFDGIRAAHSSQRLTLGGTVMPRLLLVLFAALSVALAVSWWRRRQRLAAQIPMPAGSWEAVLQEAGWSFHAKALEPPPPMQPASASTPEAVADGHEPVASAGEAVVDGVQAAALPEHGERTDQPSTPKPDLHPWSALTASRTGDRVLVLLQQGSFHALPIRCLTPDQAGHLHRMVVRKLRPSAAGRRQAPFSG